MGLHNVLKYLEENREQQLDLLFKLLKQKSISASGEGIVECADLVVDMMRKMGIRSKVMQTDGYPVVYGEVIHNPSALTVLIYGHYDVQPADPLDEWISPPFSPQIRDNKIYGRGSSDNKGQFMAHLLAISALKRDGWPPINVKILLDGEEESGSSSLPNFIEKNRELLKADVAISSDGPKHSSGKPLIFFGVRGLLYIELIAKGAKKDLHSGRYGNVSPTPAWEIVHLLNKMFSEDGKVLIPGFYDNVKEVTEYEKELIMKMPFNEQNHEELMNQETSIDKYTFWHDQMFKPSFNICGITAGYQGPGTKTVIPNKACVKIDMRLVPRQTPEQIFKLIDDFVKQNAPNIEVKKYGQLLPTGTPANLPISQAVIEAVELACGEPPIIQPRLGGSAPDYLITEHLKLPSIWVPFANADGDNHSPNENYNLKDFYDGMATSATVLYKLAQQDKERLVSLRSN